MAFDRRGRVEGKRIIVTGAGDGIGRAASVLFAREGAAVVVVDIDGAAAERTAATIRELGGEVHAVLGDASAEGDVKAFVAAAIVTLGGVDVLYANAGIIGPVAGIDHHTVDSWLKVLTVNLIGPYLAIREVLPMFRAQSSGAIICTASVAGLRGNSAPLPYSASKAGVISLVQTTANELKGTGIRINAVCPGLIETGMTRAIFEKARKRGSEDKIGQLCALNRAGTPDEIAQVALFLASDESSYITGQTIAADGGLSSSNPYVAPRSV